MTNPEELTVRAALTAALDEALATDPTVVLLGEDIADPAGGIAKVTRGLSTKYGTNRVRSTPISEQAIAGAAVGAALGGLRPVAEIMIMDFITISMDQIVNAAAKVRYATNGRTAAPLVIRTCVFAGSGAGSTHTQSFEAWLMHVPGIQVVIPSTPSDSKALLAACITGDDPTVFIEHSRLYNTSGPVEEVPPLGKAVVRRAGQDVSIISYGPCVLEAITAADTLANQGIEAEVIDLRSLVPLDLESVLRSVSRTRRAVVAHSATQFAGPGAEIAASISAELFGELLAPVERVGAAFTPTPAGPLERQLMPGTRQIQEAVLRTTAY